MHDKRASISPSILSVPRPGYTFTLPICTSRSLRSRHFRLFNHLRQEMVQAAQLLNVSSWILGSRLAVIIIKRPDRVRT